LNFIIAFYYFRAESKIF